MRSWTDRPQTHRAVAAAALALALLAGCAAPARPATVPSSAILEVANRTPRPQDIYVDGQRIGRVAPGARARFRALPARDVSLRAQPPEGGVTAETQARLAADTAAVWEVTAGDAPLAAPAGLGSLALTNALARDIEVSIDGVRVATLFVDERRLVPDVAAGPHAVEAVALVDGRRVRRTLDILPDTVTPWTIAAPMGTLRVYNEWNEPAVVAVGGLAGGTVAPGELLVVPDRFIGMLSVEARGATTGAVARAELEIKPGEVTAWHLSQSGGAVLVVNRAGEALAVAVDGEGRGLVAPLEELRVEGLAPGAHVVEVGGADSGVRLSREVRLGSGEQAVWAVDPRFGAVRIVNTSPEAQALYLDGAPVRDLAPGETATLDAVKRGPHRLAAVGRASRQRQDFEVHARPEATETWWLAGATGALVVDNRRDEALRVYVDAQPRGVVEAGQVYTLEDVAAGERLLEAVGQTSGTVFRERLVVEAAAAAIWTVRDPRALVVVENESGEVLRTGGRLAAQAPQVEEGERATFRLPPGPRRIALVGAESGFVYALETTLVEGESVAWSVTRAKGAVVIWNRSGEPLRLALDGEPLGTLEADKDVTLTDVRAGRHTVTADGQLSGAALRWPFVLAPDARTRWEVGPQLATVRVDNRTTEALEVSVDDEVWGRVEPGGLLNLSRMKPGPRALTARSLESGIRYGTELDVAVSRIAVWQVLPAEGTLVVTSDRPGPMELRVDGAPVGTTQGPGDPVTARAPAGTRVIHARALDERTHDFRTGVKVAPDRTTEVHVAREHARLDVVNDTPWTLRVWVGDRLRGESPPGTTLRIADLPPREPVDVRVTSEDAARAWRRTLTLQPREDTTAGPDATWRLLPPPVTRPASPEPTEAR